MLFQRSSPRSVRRSACVSEMGRCGPADVLVGVRASGLCQPILRCAGFVVLPLPIVLGHEVPASSRRSQATGLLKSGDHVISRGIELRPLLHCYRAPPILCEPFTRIRPQAICSMALRAQRRRPQAHHFSFVSRIRLLRRSRFRAIVVRRISRSIAPS